jgi:PIN domain nuclease of toxin-antitoxin system
MEILLDTNAFLFIVNDDRKLTTRVKSEYSSPRNSVLLSIASLWEIAIKESLGKLELPLPLRSFVTEHVIANGIALLDITVEHIVRLNELPYLHRDPFDRLIIAQALANGLPVATADAIFSEYGVERIWS